MEEDGGSRGGHRAGRGRGIYGSGLRYYGGSSIVAEFLGALIAAIVVVVHYFVTYKARFVDPIKSIKDLFVNGHLIIMGIIVVLAIIFNIKNENKRALFNKMLMLFSFSLIIMASIALIKLGMDSHYNDAKFNEFFMASELDIRYKNEYIKECKFLYDMFSMKVLTLVVIHGLLNLLLLYRVLKLGKINRQLDRIEKDDIVVYDEEQNIKI